MKKFAMHIMCIHTYIASYCMCLESISNYFDENLCYHCSSMYATWQSPMLSTHLHIAHVLLYYVMCRLKELSQLSSLT